MEDIKINKKYAKIVMKYGGNTTKFPSDTEIVYYVNRDVCKQLHAVLVEKCHFIKNGAIRSLEPTHQTMTMYSDLVYNKTTKEILKQRYISPGDTVALSMMQAILEIENTAIDEIVTLSDEPTGIKKLWRNLYKSLQSILKN